MKKLLLGMLVTLSVAGTGLEYLWKKSYTCLDPCDNKVHIVHALNYTTFFEDGVMIFGYDEVNIDVSPRGCRYDLRLKHAVTQAQFESTLNDAGFKVVSKH